MEDFENSIVLDTIEVLLPSFYHTKVSHSMPLPSVLKLSCRIFRQRRASGSLLTGHGQSVKTSCMSIY